MNKLNPESSCALCKNPVGENGVTLANNNAICNDCFQICGFSPTTPTNCLSIADIHDLLSIKNISIDDLKQDIDTEITTVPKDMDALMAEFAQNNQREDSASFDALLGLGATPYFAAPKQEVKKSNEVSIQDQPSISTIELIPQNVDKPIAVEPGEMQPLEAMKTELVSTEEAREEKTESLPTEVEPVTIPVDTEEHREDAVTDDKPGEAKTAQEIPSPVAKDKSKMVTAIKITAIVLVSAITIGVVGVFLPQGIFFGKGDAATYANNNNSIILVAGEPNEYSQEPKPEKDGYIYMVPAGTYEVTMLDSSLAFQGNIAVETNRVVLGDGGIGNYQNISSQDLLPNESVTLEVGENQHVYISIETVVELVSVDNQTKL